MAVSDSAGSVIVDSQLHRESSSESQGRCHCVQLAKASDGTRRDEWRHTDALIDSIVGAGAARRWKGRGGGWDTRPSRWTRSPIAANIADGVPSRSSLLCLAEVWFAPALAPVAPPLRTCGFSSLPRILSATGHAGKCSKEARQMDFGKWNGSGQVDPPAEISRFIHQ